MHRSDGENYQKSLVTYREMKRSGLIGGNEVSCFINSGRVDSFPLLILEAVPEYQSRAPRFLLTKVEC
jgi:hypothetical protein